MLDLETAKMHAKNTMESAFTKKASTSKKRVSFSQTCCRMIPTERSNSLALAIWASDFAKNWK